MEPAELASGEEKGGRCFVGGRFTPPRVGSAELTVPGTHHSILDLIGSGVRVRAGLIGSGVRVSVGPIGLG